MQTVCFWPKAKLSKRRDFDDKSKKLLSVFLAVVMVLSTFTVGFYAIAADDGATEDTAVTDAETSISAFYDNRSYLFSTSNPERHEQALQELEELQDRLLSLLIYGK